MGPQELKELPKENPDGLEEGDLSISDDEDVEGDESEPPADPDPELVDVDVEDDDAQEEEADEEQGDEDAAEEDEEDDDDDDDETSVGGKDDSDDSDAEEKGVSNESDVDVDDDDEEVDDDEKDGNAEKTNEGSEDVNGEKKVVFGRGKGPAGVTCPLTGGHEYKGDIEDLLRAAAQAEEGESSAGNEEIDGIAHLIRAAVERESRETPQVIIKTSEEIECEVVDILDEEEEDEGSNFKGMGNLLKDSKQSHNISDENVDCPPVKRMKNA